MKIELNGKKALVTGSSGGIGQAIAQGLAEAGAEVVLHGRDAGKLARAAQEIAARVPGARLGTVQADLPPPTAPPRSAPRIRTWTSW